MQNFIEYLSENYLVEAVTPEFKKKVIDYISSTINRISGLSLKSKKPQFVAKKTYQTANIELKFDKQFNSKIKFEREISIVLKALGMTNANMTTERENSTEGLFRIYEDIVNSMRILLGVTLKNNDFSINLTIYDMEFSTTPRINRAKTPKSISTPPEKTKIPASTIKATPKYITQASKTTEKVSDSKAVRLFEPISTSEFRNLASWIERDIKKYFGRKLKSIQRPSIGHTDAQEYFVIRFDLGGKSIYSIGIDLAKKVFNAAPNKTLTYYIAPDKKYTSEVFSSMTLGRDAKNFKCLTKDGIGIGYTIFDEGTGAGTIELAMYNPSKQLNISNVTNNLLDMLIIDTGRTAFGTKYDYNDEEDDYN